MHYTEPVKADATIVYRDTKDVDIFQLAKLFDRAGWHHRTSDLGRLARLVQNSTYVVSAWRHDELVGFARAISDDVSNAYISTVAVSDEDGKKEILGELIRRLVQGRDEITFVLQAVPALAVFYKEQGFEPAPEMFRRTRKATPA
jgi:hypothetical protein